MTNKINIYALVNPITNMVFYVGATKFPIIYRLKQHCYNNYPRASKEGILGKRIKFIEGIQKNGVQPQIKLLIECSRDKASEFEKYYYDYYSTAGYVLLQNGDACLYSKTAADGPYIIGYWPTEEEQKKYTGPKNIWETEGRNYKWDSAKECYNII
jgi:hypothetical protein